MTDIPFVDLSAQYHALREAVLAGVDDVLTRADFILGERVGMFEEAFAAYCGASYGVGVNSGTDALCLSLRAMGIGSGDEVVVPAHTFIATALAVHHAGARPVFADIDLESYCLDPEQLERALTPRTKAVIPVHLYGQPADMETITAIAREQGIRVIEDAAQAHGARFQDQRVGAFGDAGCFSFYPTKNLGAAGDGGMVVTRDPGVCERLRMFRDCGRTGRYEHRVKGYNSRLDTVQAVVLAAKLKHLDAWNAMRQEAAGWYRQGLEGVEGIGLPAIRPGCTHVFHLFVVRVSNRDRVVQRLNARGIRALVHYPVPVHLQEAFRDAGHEPGDFPHSEQAAREVISLPMFPHITPAQVGRVCEALREIVSE